MNGDGDTRIASRRANSEISYEVPHPMVAPRHSLVVVDREMFGLEEVL